MAVGGKAGLNIATVSYDPSLQSGITQSSRTVFAGGGSFVMMFSGLPIGIEADLLYMIGGTKLEADVNTGGGVVKVTQTEKLTSLQIPVLFVGKFTTKSIVSPYAYVGPALGIVLSAKTLVEAPGFESSETDAKSEVNTTDFALVFGGGAEFMVAKKIGITADVRYSLGLSDLAKSDDVKAKSRNLMFFAGVLFHL
jgi:opacity protein-like surface antigen